MKGYSFSLTDEQELLIESVQEWCNRNITETQVQQWYEDGGVPEDVTRSYVEAGFGMMGVPEKFGGTPADKMSMCLLGEAVNRHAGGFMPMSGNVLQMFDIIEFGSDSQINMALDYYKKTGKPPFSLAFSEPGAGSDNMNMTTVVKDVGGKLIMSGQKTWVSNGAISDYALVIAKDEDPSRSNTNMSWWLVPSDRKGVSFEPLHKIGNRIMPFGEMYFDDVEVDASECVGTRGKGFFQLMKNFEFERCMSVAGVLGEGQAAMDDAAAYASQRIAFEKPIASYQLIQEKLTDMEVKLHNTRNMLYECLWKLDNKMDVRLDTALLKRYGAPAMWQVADDAVQIFAGLGFTTETRVGRIMLDCRGIRIGAGTDEIMVYISGRQVSKKYAK